MSDFDPDAYLAKKRAAPRAAFDPDAYLARQQRSDSKAARPGREPKKYGKAMSATIGAVDGASLGLVDEGGAFTDAGRVAGLRVLSDPRQLLSPGKLLRESLQTYRVLRDANRKILEDARAANPKTYMAGQIAGAIAMPIPGGIAMQGARGGSALARAAKTGAALGAIQGAGDSRTDITQGDPQQRAQLIEDAIKGGAFGAAGGAVGHGVAKGAPQLLQGASNALRKLALAQGRRVLLNGADSLSNRVTSDAAVEEALRSRAIVPFGTTQGAAKRLDSLTEQWGDTYSSIVDELAAKGVPGPNARAIADDLLERALRETENTGANKSTSDAFMDEAANMIQRAASDGPHTGRLGLKQAENIKRNLQAQAKYGRTDETLLNETKREIASVLRKANEDTIEDAGKRAASRGDHELAQRAEEFVPVKQKLGRLIEAGKAATRGAQKAENRSMFGIREMGAAAMAGGDLVATPAAMVGAKVATSRLPSAVASGSYWTSELARLLAKGARAKLPAMQTAAELGGRSITAGERALLADYLRANGASQ